MCYLVWPLMCTLGIILTQTTPDYALEKVVSATVPTTPHERIPCSSLVYRHKLGAPFLTPYFQQINEYVLLTANGFEPLSEGYLTILDTDRQATFCVEAQEGTHQQGNAVGKPSVPSRLSSRLNPS